MRKNNIVFLCYEFLAVFFILTYEDAADLLGHVTNPTHQFDNVLTIVAPWVWILAALMFLGLGIWELQRK